MRPRRRARARIAPREDHDRRSPRTRTARRRPRTPTGRAGPEGPDPQPRAVVDRVQRARPPRGPRRAEPAPRARASSSRSSRHNLDEFFQVRVSGLRRQDQRVAGHHALDGLTRRPAAGRDPRRASASSSPSTRAIWSRDPRRELAAEGVEILDYDEVPEHHETLRRRFHDEIFPVLTPLAVDPGHPFPYISTLTPLDRRRPARPGDRRAALRPRQDPADPAAPVRASSADRFVLLDQVIEANLDELFRGMEILETHLFRVTRDADIAIEEDEADDLLLAIEEEIRRRRFGEAVRLEVERSMPELTRQILIKGIGVRDEDVLRGRGHAGPHRPVAAGRASTARTSRPRPHVPVIPPAPAAARRGRARRRVRPDPRRRHASSTTRTSRSRRRWSGSSPRPRTTPRSSRSSRRCTGRRATRRSCRALIRAAERGKQVVVLVEIKARFDEENNIVWARRLEQAGAHVVYGLVGLKTHSKVALVVRREGSGLRRYVHIGTGNYNSQDRPPVRRTSGCCPAARSWARTSRTCSTSLTGLSRQRVFRRLLVAPMTLRSRFLELVEREARQRPRRPPGPDRPQGQLARGQPGDRGAVRGVEGRRRDRPASCAARAAWSRASRASSEHIRVRSIIGEFLEHSRIWMFGNGGRVRVVHRLGRPHGAQPGPAGRGGDAGRGPRGAGPPGPDHRGDARRRPPLVAAGRRRHAGAAPRSSSPSRARWTPSPSSRRTRRPPARCADIPRRPHARGGLDGPARMTERCRRARPHRDRAQVPDDRRRDRRAPAGRRRAGRVRGAAARPRPCSTRTATSTRADGALAAAGYAGRLRSSGDGTIITLKGLRRQDDGGADPPARGARGAGRPRAGRAGLAAVRGAGRRDRDRRATRPLGELVARPPGAPEARLRANGTVVEVSVDDVEVVDGRPRGRAVRGARGGAARGRRGGARAAGGHAGRDRGAGRRPRRSKLERAMEAVRREPRERGRRRAGRPTDGRGDGRARGQAGRSGAQRRTPRRLAQATDPCRSDEPDAERGAEAAVAGAERSRAPSPSRRGSSSPSRRASSPTTTSPRPAARSCGSTSPGWSPARPGPAPARTPRSCTAMRVATRRQRAAWRVFGDAFDAERTDRHRGASSWSPPTSAPCATSTC